MSKDNIKKVDKPASAKATAGRVVVDRNLCIGAASCVAIAPGVFKLDEEGKAIVITKEGADLETILEAAASCPTQAISVFDEEGNQLYPKK